MNGQKQNGKPEVENSKPDVKKENPIIKQAAQDGVFGKKLPEVEGVQSSVASKDQPKTEGKASLPSNIKEQAIAAFLNIIKNREGDLNVRAEAFFTVAQFIQTTEFAEFMRATSILKSNCDRYRDAQLSTQLNTEEEAVIERLLSTNPTETITALEQVFDEGVERRTIVELLAARGIPEGITILAKAAEDLDVQRVAMKGLKKILEKER